MSYYLWKQWQINLSSVTIFRYPKQVQVSLKELNFRLKERKTVGSGQGFVPPQHLWPRLRGVFFPRDKSGPACHMSTIHPPPRKAFSDSSRAPQMATRPPPPQDLEILAAHRAEFPAEADLLLRETGKFTSPLSGPRRVNHSIEVAARDNSLQVWRSLNGVKFSKISGMVCYVTFLLLRVYGFKSGAKSAKGCRWKENKRLLSFQDDSQLTNKGFTPSANNTGIVTR